MSRYTNTERIGVIETDRIVTKDLGWIFREQPIVDVGIDAIIEEVEEGNPKGKFMAVQIKSGVHNFHEKDTGFSHYVSHIHYNYWLSLNLPIILIAHLPERDKTYWQFISEKNFRITKRKWKIEIPKNQEFRREAKGALLKILSKSIATNVVNGLYKGKSSNDTIFDYAESMGCIRDTREIVERIIGIFSSLEAKAKKFNLRLSEFAERGLTDKAPEVMASIRGYGKDLNVISSRLETEVKLFSELFAEGFFMFERILFMKYSLIQDETNLKRAFDALDFLQIQFSEAPRGINVLRSGVNSIPERYKILKEAKGALIEVLDLLIDEFGEAHKITNIVCEKIRDTLNDKPDK